MTTKQNTYGEGNKSTHGFHHVETL